MRYQLFHRIRGTTDPLLEGVISELLANFPDLPTRVETIFSGHGLVSATEAKRPW
jgi:hypothetical protein